MSKGKISAGKPAFRITNTMWYGEEKRDLVVQFDVSETGTFETDPKDDSIELRIREHEFNSVQAAHPEGVLNAVRHRAKMLLEERVKAREKERARSLHSEVIDDLRGTVHPIEK